MSVRSLYDYRLALWPQIKEGLSGAATANKEKQNDKESDIIALQAGAVLDLINDFESKRVDEVFWFKEKVLISTVDSGLWDNLDMSANNYQLQIISAVLGAPMGFEFYSIGDVRNILLMDDKKNIDFRKLIYSIFEYSKTDNLRYDLRMMSMQYLRQRNIIEKYDFTWEDLVIFSVILSCVFDKFFQLDEDDQYFTINSYGYRAIVLGIPVRKILENELSRCDWIVPYVNLSATYWNALSENSEKIRMDGSEQNTISVLLAFYSENIASAAKSAADGNNRIDEFCNEFYGVKEGIYAPALWLREIFDIYVKLSEGRLVNWLKDGASLLDDGDKKDMLKLLVYFIWNGDFGKLIQYYRGAEKPKVPCNIFLNKLSKIVHLESEAEINNCVALTRVLRENNLIPNELELIEYHEDDNKFHWNEKIIS